MIFVVVTAFAAEPSFAALDTTPWKSVTIRKTDVGAITVATSYVEGAGCVEGQVTVDVPPQSLLAVTNDMVSSPAWSSAPITTSRELSRHGDRFVMFQVLDVPAWTFSSDRYWVLEGHADKQANRYRWQRVDPGPHDIQREVQGAIEPPVNFGEWLFTPAESGTVVRYRGCADFGGPVPVRVQRWINTQQVPTLIEELVLEAQRRRSATASSQDL